MRRISAVAFMLAGLVAAGCATQLTGAALDGRSFYAVSQLPASLMSCEKTNGKLSCRPRPFRATSHLQSRFNGLAIVDSRLFYTNVSGASRHDKRQVLENFLLDADGRVAPGPCAPLVVPLFADDERRAQGLSGLAYDPAHMILYLAKRSNKARLFALQLDARSCPTGNFISLSPPQSLPDYAAIAYSAKRQTLYLLSAKRPALIEWSLKSDTVLRTLADWPKAQKHLGSLATPASLLLDDERDTLTIVDAQGRLLLLPL